MLVPLPEIPATTTWIPTINNAIPMRIPTRASIAGDPSIIIESMISLHKETLGNKEITIGQHEQAESLRDRFENTFGHLERNNKEDTGCRRNYQQR